MIPRRSILLVLPFILSLAGAAGIAFIEHDETVARELEKLGETNVAPRFADALHAAPSGSLFNARAAVSGLKALPGAAAFSPEAADIPAFAA